jgi:aspartic proteinase inhibitor
MKSNLRFVVGLTALCLILGGVIAVSGQRLGGYSPVASDNADVVAAADFAVEEQSKKQEMTYKLVSIEKAERQSAAGSNFRMCLKVGYRKEGDDEDTTEFVKVVVHRNLQQEHSLTSWAQENCGDDSD